MNQTANDCIGKKLVFAFCTMFGNVSFFTSTNMTQTIFSSNTIDIGIKYAVFNADFKSVLKKGCEKAKAKILKIRIVFPYNLF
jgi:hypothetical protein